MSQKSVTLLFCGGKISWQEVIPLQPRLPSPGQQTVYPAIVTPACPPSYSHLPIRKQYPKDGTSGLRDFLRVPEFWAMMKANLLVPG